VSNANDKSLNLLYRLEKRTKISGGNLTWIEPKSLELNTLHNLEM